MEKKNISDAQIEALRDEAAQAGDLAMVEVCELALEGNQGSRAECARVIADADADAQEGEE
jgi:hypothetical protein